MRVRAAEIQDLDLDLFDFDYDLTFMVFFLNADGRVYGRYGGRDAGDADSRMSIAGLKYAMEAALEAHRNRDPDDKPGEPAAPRTIGDYPRAQRFLRGCIHCHQVKEILISDRRRNDRWTREDFWRFPLPENVGITLEVDRGNVVSEVETDSPAAGAGLRPGDVLQRIGQVPVNSFGDAIYALDQAPAEGSVAATWKRGDDERKGNLELAPGWRETDLSWRTSLLRFLPAAGVNGRDLDPAEREKLGLSKTRLAFRQGFPVSEKAKAAGVREGDIILGFDGKRLEMTAYDFQQHVRGHYIKGDRVEVEILRDGKPLRLEMTL